MRQGNVPSFPEETVACASREFHNLHCHPVSEGIQVLVIGGLSSHIALAVPQTTRTLLTNSFISCTLMLLVLDDKATSGRRNTARLA